jgi:hypothetical protein
LDERELDRRGQPLQLLQLGVRLGEERLLVFLAAEREQGARLVALGEERAGRRGFEGG